MKSRSPIGIFVSDAKGNVTDLEEFAKEPAKALEIFLKSGEGDSGLVRKNFRQEALKRFSDKELSAYMTDFCVFLSMKNMKGAIGKDKLIIQASQAFDEITKISNTLLMRTSEWFSLHYPETKMSNEKLAEMILKYGSRENWPGFKDSLGVSIGSDDEEIMKSMAAMAFNAHEQKDALENYIKKRMHSIALNFSSLIEPHLAAKILSAAGSLEKLAKMSASEIQLIGAEKALFRHLKKQGKSPKYGMIFTSRLIQDAPEEKRGKVARVLAAKLMMAARIDFFSGRDDTEKLKKEMKEEIKKVVK